jgi:NhaP-type Na+/H+ and K+/H+ antiporter
MGLRMSISFYKNILSQYFLKDNQRTYPDIFYGKDWYCQHWVLLTAVKRFVDLKLPRSAFIVMIRRDGKFIRPGGSTEIKANDVLVVLADSQEDLAIVQEQFNRS